MTAPADLVRSYLASFATGEPDTVASHVADDFVNDHTAALGSGCEGRAEYRSRLPGFLSTFDGLRYDDVVVIGDGPRLAATYRMRATHEGHDVDIRGVMVFDVAGDLIARRTDYWDSLTFLRQVGQA
jgi:ketosteroid isomerase-like protein